jgi:hypothetical protein
MVGVGESIESSDIKDKSISDPTFLSLSFGDKVGVEVREASGDASIDESANTGIEARKSKINEIPKLINRLNDAG